MAEAAATDSSPAIAASYSTDELRKVFEKFDSNGDGKISVSELAGVFKSMGTESSAPDLQRAMEEIDTDKDGFLNLDEFAKLCRTSSSASAAAEELREAFDLYDENKDGLISEAELHQAMNRLGMKCSVEECKKMIKGVDSDGDGRVNYQEFEKMMKASSSSSSSSSNGGSAAA